MWALRQLVYGVSFASAGIRCEICIQLVYGVRSAYSWYTVWALPTAGIQCELCVSWYTVWALHTAGIQCELCLQLVYSVSSAHRWYTAWALHTAGKQCELCVSSAYSWYIVWALHTAGILYELYVSRFTLLYSRQWDTLQSNYAPVNTDFFKKLRKKFPGFSLPTLSLPGSFSLFLFKPWLKCHCFRGALLQAS